MKERAQEIKKVAHEVLLDLPTPPSKNSNELTITDAEKPPALHLFREDFKADNKLAFNGKFKGKWTVKFNSLLAVGGKYNDLKLSLADDAQLNGAIGDCDLQVKLKPEKINAQLDFRFHHAHFDFDLAKKRRNFQIWMNPYVLLETDRTLSKNTIGVGMVTHVDNWFKENSQLTATQGEKGNQINLYNNILFKHKGFFLNLLHNYGFLDKQLTKRQALFGYQKDNFNANIEVSGKDGPISECCGGKFQTASVSYDFKKNGVWGLIAKQVDAEEGKEQGNLASKLAAMDTSIGYKNTVGKHVEFKSSLSCKGLASFFFNYKASDRVSVHTSIETSIFKDSQQKCPLELPFNFGLKFKFEN